MNIRKSPTPQLAGQRVMEPYLVNSVGKVTVGIIALTSDRGPHAVSTRVTDGFFSAPSRKNCAKP